MAGNATSPTSEEKATEAAASRAHRAAAKEATLYACATCGEEKNYRGFSYTQMWKDAARKCRDCTGAPTETLTCTLCNRTLPTSAFKKTTRARGHETCNDCRREEEDDDYDQGYTGEYLGHGEWDTLTGMSDNSGFGTNQHDSWH